MPEPFESELEGLTAEFDEDKAALLEKMLLLRPAGVLLDSDEELDVTEIETETDFDEGNVALKEVDVLDLEMLEKDELERGALDPAFG